MSLARMARSLTAPLAAAGLLTGCDAQPRETAEEPRTVATAPAPAAAPVPARPPVGSQAQASKPDLDRLGFDPGNRKLTLYPLTDRSARWMLATPTAPTGVPVDREYEFPSELALDLDRVAVFYTVANRRPSPTVSLREILESRNARVLR